MAVRKKKPMPRRPVRQNVNDLLLLQRVAQRINSVLDLDVLLEEIVDDVARTFGYSRSGILLKDDATDELVIAAVRGWTVNYHVKGDRFRIGKEGMVGRVAQTGETLYAPDVRKDPYYSVSEVSTLSEIDIPLKIHGKLIGVFNAQTPHINGFPASRRQLLEALAGHIATAIENARLFGIEREQKNRMASELDQARRIQTSYFPSGPPVVDGFEVTGVCVPCNEVGGDWFDYVPLSGGRLGVVLADVSGKGLGAALLMSSARSIVRFFAEHGASPGQILAEVNRVLLRDFPKPNFVTMICAVIDPGTRSVVFANAGHPWPLFFAQSAKLLETSSGFPLGFFDSTFTETRVEMLPESRLLLYSDGVTETMSGEAGFYGTERLQQQITSPHTTVGTILNDIRLFSRGRPAGDDMTLVLVRAV
jgi:sigma-B regulation protein RsbU (phosphoserine phosphatase)